MDEFELLDSYHGKWSALPATRSSREQQTVVDVMDTIGAVTGDGVAGWWEGVSRFGDVDRDARRIIESFRLAGLDSFADMLSQTNFCREIVATAISKGTEEFEFSADQEQLLTRFDLYFSKNEPDAREALLRFLPRRAG